MKIFVMVDMEGISGICRSSQVMSDGAHYQIGRRYMTWDVNACVDGCLKGGAKRVVVRDAHAAGLIARYAIVDQLEQITTRFTLEEYLSAARRL